MGHTLRSFSFGFILLVLVSVSMPAQSPGSSPVPSAPAPTAPAQTTNASTTNTPGADNPLVNNSQLYSASMAALTELFVIAVLLENGLAVIFNWRVFLTYFSLRGVKTIIMVVSSLIIVSAFHIDVIANLIAAYNSSTNNAAKVQSTAFTVFITALIVAGGSAGVFRIMTALGFRSDRQNEIAPKPPANKAWISVQVNRRQAASEVFVKIREIGSADAGSPSPIAGVVSFKRPALAGLLFPNVTRFPENGGYTVTPNVVCSISVESKDGQGHDLLALNTQNYVFAAGAIVDFFVTL